MIISENVLGLDYGRVVNYDYDYIMAPQRGRPYGANQGSKKKQGCRHMQKSRYDICIKVS